MMAKQRCEHTVDWSTAGLCLVYDDGCDVGLTCQKCGAQGYGVVDVERVRWEEEDGEPMQMDAEFRLVRRKERGD